MKRDHPFALWKASRPRPSPIAATSTVLAAEILDNLTGVSREVELLAPRGPDDLPNLSDWVDRGQGADVSRHALFFGEHPRAATPGRFSLNIYNPITRQPLHTELFDRAVSSGMEAPLNPKTTSASENERAFPFEHMRSEIPSDIFTRSQRTLINHMLDLASVHIDGSFESGLKSQTNLLVAGPTGTGKSHAVRAAAGAAELEYIAVDAMSWIPIGAIAMPTLVSVAARLQGKSSAILHIDELDKLSVENEWSRVIAVEIYGLLDRSLDQRQVADDYLKRLCPESERGSAACLAETFTALFKEDVMFVGSGTWQALHEEALRPMGFGNGTVESPFNCLAKIPNLPPELRRRFHSEIFTMRYPEEEETLALLDAFGLVSLAERAGRSIPRIDWATSGGMAYLGSLKTTLRIAAAKKRAANRNLTAALRQGFHGAKMP